MQKHIHADVNIVIKLHQKHASLVTKNLKLKF